MYSCHYHSYIYVSTRLHVYTKSCRTFSFYEKLVKHLLCGRIYSWPNRVLCVFWADDEVYCTVERLCMDKWRLLEMYKCLTLGKETLMTTYIRVLLFLVTKIKLSTDTRVPKYSTYIDSYGHLRCWNSPETL